MFQRGNLVEWNKRLCRVKRWPDADSIELMEEWPTQGTPHTAAPTNVREPSQELWEQFLAEYRRVVLAFEAKCEENDNRIRQAMYAIAQAH